MTVSSNRALAIARLARLSLPPQELERLTLDLNRILEHVSALRQAPEETSSRETAEAARGGELRSGGGGDPDALELDLSEIAPAWADGFFLVPRLPALHEDEDA